MIQRLLLVFLLGIGGMAEANSWADVDGPTPGPSRSIGSTTAGCISGAKELPKQGDGYAVMHLERRRYFGHPSLIDAILRLAERADDGLGVLHVGDLGMARGGPMPFGHRSHQSGLDADVWFDLSPSLLSKADRNRSNVGAYSLLSSASKGLNYALWNDSHIEMLKAVAKIPSVDRVFVNAHIKRELCRGPKSDRAWLHKIRPWFHHDDHFHMRLVCPSDSPDCDRQEPIPAGDGCDSSLDWWFDYHPPETGTKPPPPPKPVLPPECRALLNQP